jgi:hypothetical protein
MRGVQANTVEFLSRAFGVKLVDDLLIISLSPRAIDPLPLPLFESSYDPDETNEPRQTNFRYLSTMPAQAIVQLGLYVLSN